jgi:hypothetical protein
VPRFLGEVSKPAARDPCEGVSKDKTECLTKRNKPVPSEIYFHDGTKVPDSSSRG